jgi:hypothetical protein
MKKLKYFALIALMMTGMINGISAMQNDDVEMQDENLIPLLDLRTELYNALFNYDGNSEKDKQDRLGAVDLIMVEVCKHNHLNEEDIAAFVNDPFDNNFTPLWIALIWRRDEETATLLTRYGANCSQGVPGANGMSVATAYASIVRQEEKRRKNSLRLQQKLDSTPTKLKKIVKTKLFEDED